MAEATEEPTAPRLSPELRGEEPSLDAPPEWGVPPSGAAQAPPAFDTFNSGNFFDPLSGGLPQFTEPEAPWWAVSDDESPYYDLYNPGGMTEASSMVEVAPGANIGMTQRGDGAFDVRTGGTGHPGDSDRFFRQPVAPSTPQSLRGVFEQYWRMSPKQRAEWQQRMYEAGFMAEPPAVWGQPDPRGFDFDAWANMAKTAARLNVPMSELAQQLADAGAGDSMRGTRGPRVPDVVLTNTADAKKMAEAIGVELMGRAPTEEETARAVQRLHALERSGGSRAQAAGSNPEGGATYEGTVSPQVAIEGALEATAPEEVAAHDQVEQFAGFLSLLGGA